MKFHEKRLSPKYKDIPLPGVLHEGGYYTYIQPVDLASDVIGCYLSPEMGSLIITQAFSVCDPDLKRTLAQLFDMAGKRALYLQVEVEEVNPISILKELGGIL
tara:strand:- start:4074 stop:4382 length:309 start_codon:yes stop_codon:yes gene_type:complete